MLNCQTISLRSFSISSARMKSPVDTVPEPPLPTDNIHNDEGNKKIVQKTTKVLTTPTPNIKPSQKKSTTQQQSIESDTHTTTPTTLKT